ncbi:hypothetical protein BH10BAC5_BH10BAC5_13290 [soil metagenome]
MKDSRKEVELFKYMLEDVRKVTLKGIDWLNEYQLFHSLIDDEAPIGAYLMHLAEVDIYWYEVLTGEIVNSELKKRCYYNAWYDCDPKSYSPPISPLLHEDYFNVMKDTRKLFIDFLEVSNDSDLEGEVEIKRAKGKKIISKKWIVYHILEHEAHHRGQIFFMIRKSGIQKEVFKGKKN